MCGFCKKAKGRRCRCRLLPLRREKTGGVPAARMIGQDVCVSCTYAVLLSAISTQNRRGNAMAKSRRFPRTPPPLCLTATRCQRQASPSGRGGSRQADGEGRRGGFHLRPGLPQSAPQRKNTGSAAFPGVFRCLISFYARCICSTISASLSHSFWACTQSPASSRREMRVSRSFFCSSSSRYSLLKCFL